jgi:hypothetical protein
MSYNSSLNFCAVNNGRAHKELIAGNDENVSKLYCAVDFGFEPVNLNNITGLNSVLSPALLDYREHIYTSRNYNYKLIQKERNHIRNIMSSQQENEENKIKDQRSAEQD